ERAADALECAIACQKALESHSWPAEIGLLRVRMALHTGDIEQQQQDFRSLILHYASRMLSSAHGGQILCSQTAAELLRRSLDSEVRLVDLGVYRLRDIPGVE